MTDTGKSGYDLTAEELAEAGAAADAVRGFRLLVFAGQRLRYLLDNRLRGDGLTTQQGVLLTLARALGRPTLGDVTRQMSTSHQNAKQIALALERKGLLAITTDSSDARVRRLEPTPAGLAGWADRNAGDYAAIGGWFSALSSAEQAQLVRLLAKLSRSLARGG